FGGRHPNPRPCYRSTVPRSFLSLSVWNSSVDPGVGSKMSTSSPRRWATMVCLLALPLPVNFVARAATDPASSNPVSAAAPDLPPAAYTANIHVTGPTTQFHDSIALRYNYAFGKESPFLPSNAMTANGQFINPRNVLTA